MPAAWAASQMCRSERTEMVRSPSGNKSDTSKLVSSGIAPSAFTLVV